MWPAQVLDNVRLGIGAVRQGLPRPSEFTGGGFVLAKHIAEGPCISFVCVSRRMQSELTETAIGFSLEEGVKEWFAGTALAFH